MVTEEPIKGERKELNVVTRRADFLVASSFIGISFIIEDNTPRLNCSTKGKAGEEGRDVDGLSSFLFSSVEDLCEKGQKNRPAG